MGADKKANTLGWGGALEIGDLCLVEDCRERGGALGSDAVGPDTARDGWGQSERAGACQWALTQKQTLRGGGLAAHLSEVTALPLSASQSLVMPSVV